MVAQNNNNIDFELTPAQKRMWLVSQNSESSIAYNIPGCYEIRGNLDVLKFRSAFFAVINRHESLRSNYFIENDGLRRSVKELEEDRVHFIVQDLRKTEGLSEAKKLADALVLQQFDVEHDVLLRGGLLQIKDDTFLFVLVMHHIASDGHSFGVFINDLLLYYSGSDLPPFKLSYSEYIEKQLKRLNNDVIKRQEQFWLEQFKQKPEILDLPCDYPRPSLQTFAAENIYFTLSGEVTRKINELVHAERTTLFTFLLSVLKLFLHKVSQQEDIVVGVPFSGRNAENNAHIGMFVNTLLIRSSIPANASFKSFLSALTGKIFESYDNQDYPFEELFEKLKIKRDLARNPGFDVMFVFHEKDQLNDVPGLVIKPQAYDIKTCAFDMLIEVAAGNDLTWKLQYNSGLFKRDTIYRFVQYVKNIVDVIVDNINIAIQDIYLPGEDEQKKLLHNFNNTVAAWPADKTIVDLFHHQSALTPHHPAIVFYNRQLTYRELDEKSNQLAHFLQKRGVGEETRVPICIERSLEMIIGVIGILKAGAAYVPIDPEYPEERIAYMLQDIQPTVQLCSSTTRSVISFASDNIIELDTEWPQISGESTHKPITSCGPSNLAYVLYTSGSTGRPKGVEMEHGALVNLLSWQQQQFKHNSRRVLQFANLTFDVSFQEIFSTLCYGSTLYLIDSDDRKDIDELLSYLELYNITHLFAPYILLKSLAEFLQSAPSSSFCVQEILVAGEQLKLSEDVLSLIKKSGCKLTNQYGPTEAHVVSSYTIDANNIPSYLPPIGRPIYNVRVYVLDKQNKLCGLGIPGELYIGGVQVARGYLNQPGLTAEKFIPDTFGNDKGARLYKTGDRCRWLPDGNLEYLGRIDDQLKMRGFRIEPGEIEHVLELHDDISQAVVVVRDEGGHKKLVAYYRSTESISTMQLRKQINKKLPAYFMPSHFVRIDEIPLTASGKADRRYLSSLPIGGEEIGPTGEWELKLAGIWKEVLKVDKISRTDDFFSLGGSSILMMKTIALVKTQIGVKLTFKDFMNQNLAAIALKCEQEVK